MSTEEPTLEADVIEQTATEEPQLDQAGKKLKKWVAWSMGGGFIPVPWADLAAIGAVQTFLINDLCEIYGVEYKQQPVKNIIATLMTSVGTGTMATGAVASLVKAIPGAGSVSGAIGLSAVAGASTYALGRVFIMHFESGGTLLDFDPEAMREYFHQQFQERRVSAEAEAKAKAEE